jgi:hypothetical protein
MVILRHRLPGGGLRSIEDRLQGPQIAKPMILRNAFSVSKNAAADQRAGMPGRQRQTLRVRLAPAQGGRFRQPPAVDS